MNRLTDKQLLAIHQELVWKENQASQEKELSADVRDEELLAKIANMPYELNETGDFYIYKNTIDKAIQLGCAIAVKKPFMCCNIKTAIISMITLMEINGISLTDNKYDLKELSFHLRLNDCEDKVRQWIERYVNTK